MDPQMTIAAVALMLTLSGVIGRIVWGVGHELRELREAVSALRLAIESQRLDEREWVRLEIARHAADCPGHETTGVHSIPVS